MTRFQLCLLAVLVLLVSNCVAQSAVDTTQGHSHSGTPKSAGVKDYKRTPRNHAIQRRVLRTPARIMDETEERVDKDKVERKDEAPPSKKSDVEDAGKAEGAIDKGDIPERKSDDNKEPGKKEDAEEDEKNKDIKKNSSPLIKTPEAAPEAKQTSTTVADTNLKVVGKTTTGDTAEGDGVAEVQPVGKTEDAPEEEKLTQAESVTGPKPSGEGSTGTKTGGDGVTPVMPVPVPEGEVSPAEEKLPTTVAASDPKLSGEGTTEAKTGGDVVTPAIPVPEAEEVNASTESTTLAPEGEVIAAASGTATDADKQGDKTETNHSETESGADSQVPVKAWALSFMLSIGVVLAVFI